MNDYIALLLSLLAFVPGMHPNSYCSLFPNSEYIAYIIGFSLILSILSIVLFYSSSDSTLGPYLGKLFRENHSYIFTYVLLFIIGALAGILLGDLYSFAIYLKNYRIFVYLLTFFLIIYILIGKNINFILGFLLSGAWGVMIIDEKYMFHIFSGMFGLPFILFNLLKNFQIYKDKEIKIGDKLISINKNSIPYLVLGIVVGYFSLLFPGISSPSVFGSIFMILSNPINYIYYYATYIGYQSTGSIYYYYFTKNVRNGYVTCIDSEFKIAEMLIGMVLGVIVFYVFLSYLHLFKSKLIQLVSIIIIIFYSFLSEGLVGLFVTIGSCIVSIINLYLVKSGADANMGVIILPTMVLLTNFLIHY